MLMQANGTPLSGEKMNSSDPEMFLGQCCRISDDQKEIYPQQLNSCCSLPSMLGPVLAHMKVFLAPGQQS